MLGFEVSQIYENWQEREVFFYCKSLCILIIVHVFLLFVHVFLTLSTYSYRCLCILNVRPCFLSLSMYNYCYLRILRRGYPDLSFSVLFPRLWGKCQGITSQEGARPALFLNWCVVLRIVCYVSFYVLFLCKCVLYFCHRVKTQLQLANISYHISKQRIEMTQNELKIELESRGLENGALERDTNRIQ